MSEHMTFLPKKDLLTLEELDRLCSAFVDLGVRKLRITGGEPLVRRNIMWFFEQMGRHLESGALDELTLTTNGSQLAKHAADLAKAGVKRINVSLDTLDAEKFGRVTRWGKLDAVLRGIEAAKREGMSVKINAVAIKDFNDKEVHEMIAWAGREDLDLTFIEVMPMGDMEEQERLGQYWPLTEVQKELEAQWTLTPSGHKTGGPARYMNVAETGKRVGFITPLTHNFCESCNRVRLTCTGMLYMCLGQDDDADLRAPLRASGDDAGLHETIREAIKRKPKGHDFDYSRQTVKGEVKQRFMSTTGG
ncbi:UNVERIFIED_CONTAM: hypothetical protein GTU68_001233 [Idotea baltica]|nr:hypothetical protein [Idotea baltica]